MNIADVVKKYVDSYGFDALADERRFSSFVDDMVSENVHYRGRRRCARR